MQYTHEHREIQNTLKRFIESEINPHVDEWEAAEIFPAHELFKKMGNLGLLGLTKPEAFGGAGLDYSYSMAMAEALGHIDCGGIPMAIGVQTDMATPALARFGSDELRAQFLAPAIAGDMVGCIGVSEPAAGSDVAGIKTHARKDGDDYVISGQKMWITNSLQADWMCMLVNTGEGPIHKNKSLVMVPMRENGKLLPGIEVGKKIKKIGMNSSDTGLIYFDEVRVPQRYRIGAEGQHLAVADQLHPVDGGVGARPQAVWQRAGRPAVGSVQAGRTQGRGGKPARTDLPGLRALHCGRRRDRMGHHGQTQGRAPEPHGA
jgi:citronellyl-CoA dehydrogenase